MQRLLPRSYIISQNNFSLSLSVFTLPFVVGFQVFRKSAKIHKLEKNEEEKITLNLNNNNIQMNAEKKSKCI